MAIRYRNIVQCPHCGFKTTEPMPANASVTRYTCPACHRETQVAEGECCIFCQLGEWPCPKQQQANQEKP